ncbi:hypothetical protein G7K_0336-t1 [Saitoella complicata NRRL Y-17804]|uniref:J domain-containing protein n=1 Tax=Saitoella complicata (strain BCRC 22490 / CBS 7301 / JCM 7358 / NBRC 10748 / NRRL Y-17804) TaxID=698492 RepID=A0A0E9N8E1_SAICN|nr:hypothetical protein G7K_0336-t1 [Saitoella complicata NRRL Y-17804]
MSSSDPVATRVRGSYVEATCPTCYAALEYELPPAEVLQAQAQLQLKCAKCDKVFSVKSPKAKASKPKARKFGTQTDPLDRTYYDLLKVDVTATEEEIKKSYRKLAVKMHPDKGGSEEEFAKLSEAYTTLADSTLRRQYNEYGLKGSQGADGADGIHPEKFFQDIFGGERFHDYIGTIAIGREMGETMARHQAREEAGQDPNAEPEQDEESEEEKKMKEAEKEEERQKRVKTLTENLKSKLDSYAYDKQDGGAKERFRQKMYHEADELKTEKYGIELLHAVGYTYRMKALSSSLHPKKGWTLGGYIPSIREKTYMISSTFSTIKKAYTVQSAFTAIQKAEARGCSPEEKAKLEQKAAEIAMGALWAGARMEVEGVIRDVCDNVLWDDPSVDNDVKVRRVEALEMLGHIFESTKGDKMEEEFVKINVGGTRQNLFLTFSIWRARASAQTCLRSMRRYLPSTKMPEQHVLELEDIDRGFMKEMVKAVLHSILFNRIFVNDLEVLLDERTSSLLNALSPAPSPTTSPPPGQGHARGQLAMSFYEKRVRKAWFSTQEESVVWERWLIVVDTITPRTERERLRSQREMERQLNETLLKIVRIANEKKEHIPPILTGEANPFPYEIHIVKGEGEGWVGGLKKLLVDQPS